MSTRRARIKAVASLPVRRKNTDTSSTVSNNSAQQKEFKENTSKSPRSLETTATLPPLSNDCVLFESNNSKTLNTFEKESSFAIPDHNTEKSFNKVRTPKISHITRPIKQNSYSNDSSKNCVSPSACSPQNHHVNHNVKNIVSPSFGSLLNGTKELEVPRATTLSEISPKVNQNPKEHNRSDNQIDTTTHSSTEKRSTGQEDFNPPSISDSLTEDAVMDGIVLLQPESSAPKPIAMLKNEIISENAEVLFDPIVPLPSPSKVRPKLRPVPRLNPLRRNSVQGSASESEDESRRAILSGRTPTPTPTRQRHDSQTSCTTAQTLINKEISRIRNDSISSSASQIPATNSYSTSPHKDKHQSKSRRTELRRPATRRRRDPPPSEPVTMYDLIFYNPTTNPIIPDQDEVNAKEADAFDEKKKKISMETQSEEEDDPPETSAAPVPQIKLGPNGEIILDEKSLVINRTESNRKISSRVVREGAWGSGTSGGRYPRSVRSAEWSDVETVRFYRALAAAGTDFSLMAQLFPNRSRKDLKLKFKKEERLNGAQVDKALRSATRWDVAGLGDEFSLEREEAAKQAAAEAERLRMAHRQERHRMRQAKVARQRRNKEPKSTVPEERGNQKQAASTSVDVTQKNIDGKESGDQMNVEKNRNKIASPFATLSSIQDRAPVPGNVANDNTMATISKMETKDTTSITGVPENIETGSLVVLSVNDPNCPEKKMLQTYISHDGGKLTPIALPPDLLNSVVGYMKQDNPKNNVSTVSSPGFMSPNSISSQDSRTSVIQVNPSPIQRQRHTSYTITQL